MKRDKYDLIGELVGTVSRIVIIFFCAYKLTDNPYATVLIVLAFQSVLK